ncbi:hypothetical protein J6590_066614 [Homalodisca vitripennis]|nr:hypothetical protein J6590_066614 [Homalodisca vitripennis]
MDWEERPARSPDLSPDDSFWAYIRKRNRNTICDRDLYSRLAHCQYLKVDTSSISNSDSKSDSKSNVLDHSAIGTLVIRISSADVVAYCIKQLTRVTTCQQTQQAIDSEQLTSEDW